MTSHSHRLLPCLAALAGFILFFSLASRVAAFGGPAFIKGEDLNKPFLRIIIRPLTISLLKPLVWESIERKDSYEFYLNEGDLSTFPGTSSVFLRVAFAKDTMLPKGTRVMVGSRQGVLVEDDRTGTKEVSVEHDGKILAFTFVPRKGHPRAEKLEEEFFSMLKAVAFEIGENALNEPENAWFESKEYLDLQPRTAERFAQLALEKGNVGVCSTLVRKPESGYRAKIDDCYQLVAEELHDVDICYYIAGKEKRHSCVKEVALYRKDPAVCKNIAGDASVESGAQEECVGSLSRAGKSAQKASADKGGNTSSDSYFRRPRGRGACADGKCKSAESKQLSKTEISQKDREGSIEALEQKALQDDAHAQYEIGLKYLKGDGVVQNMLKAQVWLSLAQLNGKKIENPAEVKLSFDREQQEEALQQLGVVIKKLIVYHKENKKDDKRAASWLLLAESLHIPLEDAEELKKYFLTNLSVAELLEVQKQLMGMAMLIKLNARADISTGAPTDKHALQRRSDVNAILNGIWQYAIDHQGKLPGRITAKPTEICRGDAKDCKGMVNLKKLVGKYLVSVPVDPQAPAKGKGTWYTVRLEKDRMTVAAPHAEGAEISVTNTVMQRPKTFSPSAVSTTQPPPTTAAPLPPTADDDPVLGKRDAKVAMIEFTNYQDPFSSRHFKEAFPQIKSEYIDTGQVKYIVRDYPFSFYKNSQKAAEATECADDQGKFWEMRAILFQKQQSWASAANATELFKQYAGELGLKNNDFASCLDSGNYAAEVQKDLADGKSAAVTGTPTFFINSRKITGAQPFSAFKTVMESEVGGSPVPQPPSVPPTSAHTPGCWYDNGGPWVSVNLYYTQESAPPNTNPYIKNQTVAQGHELYLEYAWRGLGTITVTPENEQKILSNDQAKSFISPQETTTYILTPSVKPECAVSFTVYVR